MTETENILSYPSTVFVGKNVPKKAFYDNMAVNNRIRQRFVEDVEQITWLYKLTADTLGVDKGETVHEITVFHVLVKSQNCPNDVFTFIDKGLPRHTVFILENDGKCRLLINYKQWTDEAKGVFRITESYYSRWMSQDQLRLPLSGMSLDLIYNSIVSYVSGIQPVDNADLKKVVELQKAISAKRKVVSVLENKIRAERQFSEQMIINAGLKIARKDLETLENELKDLL
jgi:hypothetical protein